MNLYKNMPRMNKATPENVNMWPVGFRCTRILTEYICPNTSHARAELRCDKQTTNYEVRATSHTRLRACDHCNLRALIGRNGGDRPSSLHTWRWRPKGPKKTSWMKSLHGVLHGGLWIRFHGLLEFASSPPLGGGPAGRKFREIIISFYFFA